ncbi:pentatricopeptide repeat-containing protein at2g27610 [Phtheirospermum japonicum]|uniref:Pentatricopeptide repeat-containing protein at2g27610 n=1 Tax=Phtheirospermum japonicum TaxID=374723 RepID=A0A830C7N9_9LAMI|nr:pentatricopeptide repeat-containing protein at2g27610 [Phtheirospermum japonicum]
MYKFGNLRTNTTSKHSSLIDANKYLTELLKRDQIDEARKVFDKMPERDEFTWNTIISGYANSGKPAEARQLFDKNPKKSAITWSSLISGYCNMGHENESFQLFYEMQRENYKPNQFTLGSVLRLCSIKGLLSRGEQIHGYVIKTHFDLDVFVITGLIDVYAKCLRIVEAEHLFKTMSDKKKNHVTWTAMINGYSLNGDAFKAIECFAGMREKGVEANQYTFPGVLTACASFSDLRFGTQVHGCVFRGGFFANVFVQSALVDMYTKCGDLSSGLRVVESMAVDDVISWNAMIVGFVRHGFPERALTLFETMRAKNMGVDEFTYPSVLNSLALSKDVMTGMNIHSLVIKSGFERFTLVCNALIDMYAKQENLDSAFKLFDFLVEKDVISWTSLITGYAHGGSHEKALKLFCNMWVNGVRPDQVVVSSVLSSCAELALLDFGQQIHGNSIKSGLTASLSVDNSLVSLYAHCGYLENAEKIFNLMKTRNVISWTALIVGYAKNGEGIKSLRFYDEMIASNVNPDFITFIGLLFACSHAGLTERGRYYFKSMVNDYNINPGPDHYACMIDLLGRSGKLNEAEELLGKMTVKPDSAVWKSLLSACRTHGNNIDLAKRAATALIELEPQDPVPYVMLSNIYSVNKKWDEAASVRKLMRSRGVGKEPGRSWMEMNGKVYSFVSEDRSHLETSAIFLKIEEMMILIKEAGYVPDMNFALHDINEEGKVYGLAYHSEKLAVAFGLIKLPIGAPVRVYKNIRVCGDCHSAMKFVSKVYGRHVILRDSNCFHHFREGVCSCGDYW